MNCFCGKFSLSLKFCFYSFSSGNTVLLMHNIKYKLENGFISTSASIAVRAILIYFKMFNFNENDTTCL